MNPRIAGLRLSVLAAHYRARLRRQLAAELMAGAGVAVGVALVFGVLLASSSTTGSAPELIRSVDGRASIAVRARSGEGMSESMAQRAGRAPGVRFAAFALRENAQLAGPGGRRAVQVVGLSSDIAALHSAAARDLGAAAALLDGGIGLPAQLAGQLGVRRGGRVTLRVSGEARSVPVRAVLGASAVGPVSEQPIAVAQINVAQSLTGYPGRVSEVLIEPARGAGARVTGELRRRMGAEVSVVPAGRELQVLEATARPLRQSTGLFAAIGAIVGLLFVVNAMLLTLPDRRRLVAELHTQGFEIRQIAAILGFQALLLGLGASLAGIGLGYLLALTVLHQSPVYLAVAFPIQSTQPVSIAIAATALAGGVAAALLASLPPLVELVRGRLSLSSTAQPVQRLGARATWTLGALGVGLLIIVTVLVLVDPALTVVGGVLLALAVPCLIPALFALVLRLLHRLGRRVHGGMVALAAIELRATATRSVALIGVAAIAVYGSVAVQGARADLIRGLDRAAVDFLDTAQVWVTTDDNFLTINSFRADATPAAIARLPQVSSVRPYESGLIDLGTRRVWIKARPPGERHIIQASQMLEGNLSRAESEIRRGGFAAISKGIAQERHLHLGDVFTLPSATGPVRLRVAAITTNTGWSPGAITMSLPEYRARWHAIRPTALEVSLKPGVSEAAGAAAVRAVIRGRGGLQAQTYTRRRQILEGSAREGLRSLAQISTLLLITAALAVAAVLSASIWQRRGRLAALKAHGFEQRQLWRALMIESAIAVAIGCLDGALLGLYGHALASRFLSLTTGFPAPFAPGLPGIATALATVAGITILIVGLLGIPAARVPAELAFADQG